MNYRVRDLDRKVQFRRYTVASGDFGETQSWSDHGTEIWAAKKDASDAERWRAGELSASITARFRVYYTTFTAAISAKDRLVCDGTEYEITGIKEVGERRFRWLEITTAARADK